MTESIIQRLFGRYLKPRGVEQSAPAGAEVRNDIAEYVRREVSAGYSDFDEMRQTVIEVFEGELDSAELELLVPRLLEEALEAHRLKQLSWPLITDCDRLDSAFLALEQSGVLARQHYSCCGTCGSAEISDELTKAASEGKQVRGYTFFHVQDTESATEGDGLYLNYGALEEGEASAIEIGHEIVAALERSGLHSDWDGDWVRRIDVSLDWKRRRAD